MKECQIRAHHGMCLTFFKGKGYSNEFAEHMMKVKELLENNPVVEIINDTDVICEKCPNNKSGICEKPDKVAGYDNQVLKLCDLVPGSRTEWKEFEKLVQEKILKSGKRQEICGDCQWDSLCN